MMYSIVLLIAPKDIRLSVTAVSSMAAQPIEANGAELQYHTQTTEVMVQQSVVFGQLYRLRQKFS